MVIATANTALDETLRAVSDETRRSILRLTRHDEVAAGDIASVFAGMSRPAVSQHLRVLVQAGLVEVRQSGRRRMYRARTDALEPAVEALTDLWAGRLARLRDAAEATEVNQKRSR